MELDHERFQGAQELAEISVKIAAGTAALTALKESEENYLAEREEKLAARLKYALVESGNLIKAIGENHDALIGYRNALVNFHEHVLSLIEGVKGCTNLIDNVSMALEAEVSLHEQKVKSHKESVALQNIGIQNSHKEIGDWRRRLTDEQRRIEDRSAMLERTVQRLRKT